MTKLKCWKKTRDDKFAKVFLHKTKNIGVSIQEPLDSRDQVVAYYGGRNNASSKDVKGFKDGLKFANKYMKEHDKC